jgi:hypothetical protein
MAALVAVRHLHGNTKSQITNHKYQTVRQAHRLEPSRKANPNDQNSKFQTGRDFNNPFDFRT